MKRILGILATVVAVSALIWVILESREGRYSSYASQPETPAPQQSAGASLTYNFDAGAVDAMPVKFHSARTGKGAESKWVVMADPTAPSKPNVVAQTSTDTTDYRFPVLIADEGSSVRSVTVRTSSQLQPKVAATPASSLDTDTPLISRLSVLTVTANPARCSRWTGCAARDG